MLENKMKQRRIDKNLTMQELADKLGVTKQAVQNWESGRKLPRMERLMELAQILDIPVHELATNLSEVRYEDH